MHHCPLCAMLRYAEGFTAPDSYNGASVSLSARCSLSIRGPFQPHPRILLLFSALLSLWMSTIVSMRVCCFSTTAGSGERSTIAFLRSRAGFVLSGRQKRNDSIHNNTLLPPFLVPDLYTLTPRKNDKLPFHLSTNRMRSYLFTPVLSFALLESCFAIPTSFQPRSVCDDVHSIAPSRLAYAPLSAKASLNSLGFTQLYKKTIATYWDAASDADVPACAFFPASAQGVSAAVIALEKNPGFLLP